MHGKYVDFDTAEPEHFERKEVEYDRNFYHLKMQYIPDPGPADDLRWRRRSHDADEGVSVLG